MKGWTKSGEDRTKYKQNEKSNHSEIKQASEGKEREMNKQSHKPYTKNKTKQSEDYAKKSSPKESK